MQVRKPGKGQCRKLSRLYALTVGVGSAGLGSVGPLVEAFSADDAVHGIGGDMTRGRLKLKREDLKAALDGDLAARHEFVLKHIHDGSTCTFTKPPVPVCVLDNHDLIYKYDRRRQASDARDHGRRPGASLVRGRTLQVMALRQCKHVACRAGRIRCRSLSCEVHEPFALRCWMLSLRQAFGAAAPGQHQQPGTGDRVTIEMDGGHAEVLVRYWH